MDAIFARLDTAHTESGCRRNMNNASRGAVWGVAADLVHRVSCGARVTHKRRPISARPHLVCGADAHALRANLLVRERRVGHDLQHQPRLLVLARVQHQVPDQVGNRFEGDRAERSDEAIDHQRTPIDAHYSRQTDL